MRRKMLQLNMKSGNLISETNMGNGSSLTFLIVEALLNVRKTKFKAKCFPNQE